MALEGSMGKESSRLTDNDELDWSIDKWSGIAHQKVEKAQTGEEWRH